MENALRACCKGIKIGKILIHADGKNGRQLIYEKLPEDISSRHVLLPRPCFGFRFENINLSLFFQFYNFSRIYAWLGNSAVKAISLLLSKGVAETSIIFLNLIAAPEGIHTVCRKFPKLKIVPSEIDSSLDRNFGVMPGRREFGDRYFGTD